MSGVRRGLKGLAFETWSETGGGTSAEYNGKRVVECVGVQGKVTVSSKMKDD